MQEWCKHTASASSWSKKNCSSSQDDKTSQLCRKLLNSMHCFQGLFTVPPRKELQTIILSQNLTITTERGFMAQEDAQMKKELGLKSFESPHLPLETPEHHPTCWRFALSFCFPQTQILNQTRVISLGRWWAAKKDASNGLHKAMPGLRASDRLSLEASSQLHFIHWSFWFCLTPNQTANPAPLHKPRAKKRPCKQEPALQLTHMKMFSGLQPSRGLLHLLQPHHMAPYMFPIFLSPKLNIHPRNNYNFRLCPVKTLATTYWWQEKGVRTESFQQPPPSLGSPLAIPFILGLYVFSLLTQILHCSHYTTDLGFFSFLSLTVGKSWALKEKSSMNQATEKKKLRGKEIFLPFVYMKPVLLPANGEVGHSGNTPENQSYRS